ncbi:type I-E CRISPR-associated protein Cse2/CasB [Fluviispira multicolorata]|uniref:Type I-E CRISPR-associated protein Cse2/CasB n=1 Tax=Fluviispira multicolorata TaxID=2654512 RepID=A0A833JGR8_9BACT|nr:type I-E CRISPR-associated protein Cse2/CasB [Fluviispira multicolorata]KAB8032261.1 hypothetical protein GCL57_06325 [Fluviispira multicolorata]
MSIKSHSNSDELSNYFYGISKAIDDLLIEREEDRSALSKELIAKIKSARNRVDRFHLIYFALVRKNIALDLNQKNIQFNENILQDTLMILCPIQASLGYSKAEKKENFPVALGKMLETPNSENYNSIERRFLNLLHTPREHLSIGLHSLISIMNSNFDMYKINWCELYLDIYYWDKNKYEYKNKYERIQYKWAVEFYNSLNLPSKNDKKKKE